jgi:hypothetical protein
LRATMGFFFIAFFLPAFRFAFFAIIVLPFLLPMEKSVGPFGGRLRERYFGSE